MQPFTFDHVSTLAGAVQAAAHTEAAFSPAAPRSSI
jgi:hypothetical protein